MNVRVLLSLLFGLVIASSYGLAWLLLERAFTSRAWTAVAFVGGASAVSAMVASAVLPFLARRPWTARVAAAFIVLSVGTVGLTSLLLGISTASAFHPLRGLPVGSLLIVIALNARAALYNVLSLAGYLLLPLGLPATVAFAFFFTQRRG